MPCSWCRGADEVALGVVAEQVEVVGAQAERGQPQGDEVSGLPGTGADPGVDHVTVGVGQGQLGDGDDRVHSGPAQHQHLGRVRVPAHPPSSPWSYTVTAIPRSTSRSVTSGSIRDQVPPARPQRLCGACAPTRRVRPLRRRGGRGRCRSPRSARGALAAGSDAPLADHVGHPHVPVDPHQLDRAQAEVVPRAVAVPGAVRRLGSGQRRDRARTKPLPPAADVVADMGDHLTPLTDGTVASPRTYVISDMTPP